MGRPWNNDTANQVCSEVLLQSSDWAVSLRHMVNKYVLQLYRHNLHTLCVCLICIETSFKAPPRSVLRIGL